MRLLERLRDLAGVGGSLYRAVAGRDPITRYNARYGLVRRVVRGLGFTLYNNNLVWESDAEFLEAWRSFPEHGAEIKDRHFVLYSLARSVAGLPGDTVECGVFAGAGSHLICAATARHDRTHHVFDSFAGLSEPTSQDHPLTDYSYRWRKHDLSVPLERVARNLAQHPRVELHQGWIPERFPDVASRQFSFVHVDVDLFEPTRDSLEFFYPRMVPGGILLCDDYGSAACPGAKRAFDELAARGPEKTVVHLPTGQGFVVKK